TTYMERHGHRLTESRRSELLSVYLAEREDDQSSLAVAFAIIAGGLTYVLAATSYLSAKCGQSGCGTLPTALSWLSPLIAQAFVGFLILNAAATRLRSVHLHRPEKMLRTSASGDMYLRSYHPESGIVFRPDY